jgi:hypothetical protein
MFVDYLRSLKYFLELVHVEARKKLRGVIHLFIRFVLSMMLIWFWIVRYGYVTPDDVPELLEQHIGQGKVIEQLWR